MYGLFTYVYPLNYTVLVVNQPAPIEYLGRQLLNPLLTVP